MDITVSPDEKYPDFSFSSITAFEGIALKKRAGIANRQDFANGLDNDDPEAWQALVWLLRGRKAREAGEPEPRLSETDFPWGSCQIEYNEAESARITEALRRITEAQKAGEPEPDIEPVETGHQDPTEANPST